MEKEQLLNDSVRKGQFERIDLEGLHLEDLSHLFYSTLSAECL